jgi:hypothetical protein
MSMDQWTESQIQSLKAQEAKDLAIKFLEQLKSKEQGPISPGEVQLKELEFELKVKQAEIEDAKLRRAHEEKLRELQLQIEKEKAKAADSQTHADEVRQELQSLIERVRTSEESLSLSLERTTRQHRLRLEQLGAEAAQRKAELEAELQSLSQQRDDLSTQIQQLSELHVSASHLAETRAAIAARQAELHQHQQRLEEDLAHLEFTKKKQLSEVKQAQELELARLTHEHDKQVLRLDRESAEKILNGLQLVAVTESEQDSQRREIDSLREQLNRQNEAETEKLREQFRREYNITTTEPIDVTALYYHHQSAQREITRLTEQVQKLENALNSARHHIEAEPQRIAAAVEAARTPIQNIVEPATKR